MPPPTKSTPESILILGTGVFGLATLSALLTRPQYASTTFTMLAPASQHSHTASVDSTRIIRADYSDAAYSALAAEAQHRWRHEPWKQHYSEPGLLLSYSSTPASAPIATEREMEHSHSASESTSKSGEDYVRASLRTVTSSSDTGIEVFSTPAALTQAMAVPGSTRQTAPPVKATGAAGYINRRSGWADAGGALNALRQRLQRDGGARVRWVDGEAVRLLLDGRGQSGDAGAQGGKQRGLGVETAAGEKLLASMTIIATGAWTPRLLDLRGIASCTAQCMAYVSVSEAEAAQLAHLPVCFDLTQGMFFFPPTRRAQGARGRHEWEIKVARHAYGYSNPQPTAFGVQSLPMAPGLAVPEKDRRELLAFLAEAMPFLHLEAALGRGEREVNTRLCHYLDTASGDWIVSPHPDFDEDSLFVATGGSGHGYKFLPVVGEQIVNILEHKDDDETNLWKTRWAWPVKNSEQDMVWCEDGSRAGVKGLTLQQSQQPADM